MASRWRMANRKKTAAHNTQRNVTRDEMLSSTAKQWRRNRKREKKRRWKIEMTSPANRTDAKKKCCKFSFFEISNLHFDLNSNGCWVGSGGGSKTSPARFSACFGPFRCDAVLLTTAAIFSYLIKLNFKFSFFFLCKIFGAECGLRKEGGFERPWVEMNKMHEERHKFKDFFSRFSGRAWRCWFELKHH